MKLAKAVKLNKNFSKWLTLSKVVILLIVTHEKHRKFTTKHAAKYAQKQNLANPP